MLLPLVQQAAEEALLSVFQTAPGATGWRGFLEAWFGFSDWRLMLRLAVGIAVSVLLASVIAFHPRTYGRAETIQAFEQPTALLLYAIIGAVVAQIVAVQPAMAFVVFGIGGLLRFRTVVGEADDTGQVILVTVVGVACGLHQYPLAALATAAGWILLFRLNARRARSFAVEGIEASALDAVAHRLGESLRGSGFQIVRQKVNAREGRIQVLIRGPADISEHDIERAIESNGERQWLKCKWDD